MKVHNFSDDSQDSINHQNIILQDQNIELCSQNRQKTVKVDEKYPQNCKTAQTNNNKKEQIKQIKIPQTMKIFLKKKRVTSQFMEGGGQVDDRNSQKLPLNSNQIYQHGSKDRKTVISSIKALKELQNTTQTINNQTHTNPEAICRICEGQISKNKKKQKIFDCGHQFCSGCTKSYIEYKIRMFEQISCPNQNCKGNLNQKSSFYCNQVSLKQRKQYLKIHRFFQIHKSNGTKRLCPKQECEGIVDINTSSDVNKCKTCGFEVCSKCFAQAHSGECEDYETKFLKENFHLIKCQKCKNFIQKSQGCHHISCKCGYEFCQKCNEPWMKRHICKYTGLSQAEEGWGGCDWGITGKDHIKFLLKLPIKFVLVILLAVAWTLFSFLGAPLNLMLMLYWIYLLLIRPSIQMMKNEEKCWKIMVQIVFFPFFMVINIGEGAEYFVSHIDELLPEISNSFRSVVRL